MTATSGDYRTRRNERSDARNRESANPDEPAQHTTDGCTSARACRDPFWCFRVDLRCEIAQRGPTVQRRRR